MNMVICGHKVDWELPKKEYRDTRTEHYNTSTFSGQEEGGRLAKGLKTAYLQTFPNLSLFGFNHCHTIFVLATRKTLLKQKWDFKRYELS